MNFSMAISENLVAYQELNSHVSIHFSPVVIKKVKLAWNEVEKVDPSMKIAFNKSIPVAANELNGAGSFNGRLDLSLFGACPLQDPFSQEFPKKLKLKNYLVSNNLFERYENGNKSEQRRLKKIYQSDTKGDSMTKENPNRLVIDDNDYLGVSNSFISNKFNRTKSWGSKMKKKSYNLSLLNYNKKSTFIQSFPLTFNVRKYLSINYPEKYNRFFLRRDDNSINVYETLYDEIIPNISLTTRRSK